ncbi:hypothetical protein HY949_02305 [Candidatus Gottesmanbacteria bacterium]|nr:hypothetical protein [Candidatus Gottesmanbacteria bacterium]
MANIITPTVPVEPTTSMMPSALENGTVVVPPSETPKKGPGLGWLAVLLGVAILGGAAYFYYTSQQKPAETNTAGTPGLTNQVNKPNQGFDASAPTPTAVTPTLTSGDSVTDIEKDLKGTSINSGNSNEFDADLQSL